MIHTFKNLGILLSLKCLNQDIQDLRIFRMWWKDCFWWSGDFFSLNQDIQDLRIFRMWWKDCFMLFFRWLVYSIFAITNYPSWKSWKSWFRQNHLQNPHKQSLNNILKNPNFPQTIIKQHPEKSQLPTNNHPTTSCKSWNPEILKILKILIQTKSSPKSPQTIIKQHPENPENPENPDSDKIISKIPTNNH